jgi:hypothetical protein
VTLKPTTLVLAALLFSCTQEDIIVKEYARLGEVTVQPQSLGATFSGKITKPGNESVIQHGFEWGFASSAGELIGRVDRVNLGSLDGLDFSVTIKRGVEKHMKYLVRAFVETEKFRVVGSWTAFIGTGSEAPFVTAIAPSTATWGDTLEVKGINFSFNPEIVKVMFSGTPGDMTTLTPELIRVVIPVFTDTTRTALTITVGEESSESNQIFQLSPIEVSSISPTSVKSQTLVTVKGKNFLPSGNRIYLSGVLVALTAMPVNRKNEIQFLVPNTTQPGGTQLKIVSGPMKKIIENALTRTAPVITSVSPIEVFEGETITVKGSNFGEGYSDNLVTLGTEGQEAQITRIAAGEIEVVLPALGSLDLVVTADNVSTVVQNAITIKKPVVTGVTLRQIYPGQLVAVNGDYLFGGFSGTSVSIGGLNATVESSARDLLTVVMPPVREFESSVVVAAFDKSSNAEVLVASPARAMQITGPALYAGSAFSIGTNGYLVAVDFEHESNDSQGNVVWKYDQSAGHWTQLEIFPGERRSSPFCFVKDGKGYLVGGRGTSRNFMTDVWQFDPSTEEWTRLNDCPFGLSVVALVGGEVFGLCLSTTEAVWKYDFGADTWSQQGKIPSELIDYDDSPAFNMTIDNRFFVGVRDRLTQIHHLYEYLPATNEWISKGDISIGDYPFAFEYNGDGFVVTDGGKLLRYQPSTNAWSVLEQNLVHYFHNGGEPAMFNIGNRRYFGLGGYNRFAYITDKENMNLFFEVDCLLADF